MAHHYNPAHLGIRTKRYKLIFYYSTDYKGVHNKEVVTKYGGNRFGKDAPVAWELYDLELDPHEMHNRYADPEYKEIVGSLKKQLTAQREQVGDTDESNLEIKKIIQEHWNR